VQQLIHNLYSNAVKYNIANGWIDFKLTQKLNWLELTIEILPRTYRKTCATKRSTALPRRHVEEQKYRWHGAGTEHLPGSCQTA